MKKMRISIMILLILFFSVPLTSCLKIQGKIPTDMIAEVMTELEGKIPVGEIYFSEAETGGYGYLSRGIASYVYTGVYDENFQNISCAESYAVFLSSGLDICEIHIYHAKNRSDIPILTKMLACRLNTLSKLNSDNYFPNMLNGGNVQPLIFSDGLYVFLTASKYNDEIAGILLR